MKTFDFGEREILFIRTLAFCGCSTGKMLSVDSLKDFIRCGLVVPNKYQAGKKEKTDYRPTKKLENKIKELRNLDPRLNLKFLYKSTSDFHDLKLEKHVDRAGIKVIYVEKQIRNKREQLIREGKKSGDPIRIAKAEEWELAIAEKRVSTPDMLIEFLDGHFEYVEAITNAYTKEMKETKKLWAKMDNDTLFQFAE